MNYNKILIIGIAGGLAQITATLLNKKYPKAQIFGVDMRSVHNFGNDDNIKIKKIRYTRGNFEKIFRDNEFDLVIHLGRLTHAAVENSISFEQRLDMSIMGTNKILDLSLQNKVKKIIVLSTFHVYGAASDNPAFINEEMPLRASLKNEELRDVVEMDQIATNWMWKNQNDIECVVLRPCNIIGPKVNNTISKYLAAKFTPVPLDYDPMFQFIHEFDMSNIIIECLDKVPTGIYNVAPDEVISLKKAKSIAQKSSAIQFPMFVGRLFAKFVNKNIIRVPDYLIEYLMYPCLIDNEKIKKYTGKEIFRFKTEDALKLLQLKS